MTQHDPAPKGGMVLRQRGIRLHSFRRDTAGFLGGSPFFGAQRVALRRNNKERLQHREPRQGNRTVSVSARRVAGSPKSVANSRTFRAGGNAGVHLKGLRRIMLHYAMSPGAGLGVAHPAFRCVPARLGGADVDATHKRRNIDKCDTLHSHRIIASKCAV